MLRTTPLLGQHKKAAAHLVDFAGWELPLHYGSQIAEHNTVREDAGIFDVSHMNPVDIVGPQARDFLRILLANDVDKLKQPGRAIYSCMLNEKGGVIDDLIAYYLGEQRYCLVLNAATRDKDMAWLTRQSQGFSLKITPRADFAMVSVQGPQAKQKTHQALTASQQAAISDLKPFQCVEVDDWLVATTGYTGEAGYEIILPAQASEALWTSLLAVGIKPCGLGARDMLRLEAGMSLYGAEMDETTTPLESNLAWTVAWQPDDRAFIGREALMAEKARGASRTLIGLVLEKGGVLRSGLTVFSSEEAVGVITSGGYSPTLKQSVALARVTMGAEVGACEVALRGKQVPVHVVKPPFVRHGKKVF